MRTAKSALGSWRSAVSAAVLAAITFAVPVQAQVLYGSLTGNVIDASAAAVPSAKVEALNNDTGLARQTLTDERGTYLFSDLQPGSYKITISAPSFSVRTFDGVLVDANTIRRLDATVQVSQMTESVTVAASAVLRPTAATSTPRSNPFSSATCR